MEGSTTQRPYCQHTLFLTAQWPAATLHGPARVDDDTVCGHHTVTNLAVQRNLRGELLVFANESVTQCGVESHAVLGYRAFDKIEEAE